MRWFTAGLLALGLVGSAPARAEVAVNVGHMATVNLIHAVAEHLGLYEKNGLKLERKVFQSGAAALAGLLSGDLQVVEAGAVPMLNLAAQGQPLYYLAGGGLSSPDHPAGSIMIRPDETEIKSVADLRGKKVGQLAKGVQTYYNLATAIEHYGLTRKDFQEIFTPLPQMGGLLASKQVDAVYVWPPYDTMIAQAGQGKILANDTEWTPYMFTSGIIVRREWADENEETVRKMMKIAIEANRWIDDHPKEARDVIGKALNLPESVYREMRTFYYPRNGYQVMPAIWDFYYAMVKTGEFKPFADPKKVIDEYWIKPAERFITPALAELGVQDDPVVDKLLKVKLPNLPEAPEAYYAPWDR